MGDGGAIPRQHVLRLHNAKLLQVMREGGAHLKLKEFGAVLFRVAKEARQFFERRAVLQIAGHESLDAFCRRM